MLMKVDILRSSSLQKYQQYIMAIILITTLLIILLFFLLSSILHSLHHNELKCALLRVIYVATYHMEFYVMTIVASLVC